MSSRRCFELDAGKYTLQMVRLVDFQNLNPLFLMEHVPGGYIVCLASLYQKIFCDGTS